MAVYTRKISNKLFPVTGIGWGFCRFSAKLWVISAPNSVAIERAYFLFIRHEIGTARITGRGGNLAARAAHQKRAEKGHADRAAKRGPSRNWKSPVLPAGGG
jgi:hypothetical protein